MVKLRNNGAGSGYSEFISGWIQTLFPYLACGSLNKELHAWHEMYFYGPELEQFPPLASSAMVDWDYHGTVFDLEFYAGMLGFEQDVSKDGALRPLMGWYVCHDPPKPPALQLQQYKKELEDLLLGHKDEAVDENAPWYRRVSTLKQKIAYIEANEKHQTALNQNILLPTP